MYKDRRDCRFTGAATERSPKMLRAGRSAHHRGARHVNGGRMAGLLAVIALLAATGAVHGGAGTSRTPQQDPVASAIRSRLERDGAPSAGARLNRSALVGEFYGARDYRPAWVGRDTPGRRALALVRAVESARDHGLEPATYHASALDSLVRATAAGPAPDLAAELDVLLTDAYLAFAEHRARGRVDPRSVHSTWNFAVRPFDAIASLRAAIETGVEPALAAADPPGREYADLRRALGRYLDLARVTWPAVPDGATLREGDRGPRVAALWRRLAVEQGGVASESDVFDAELTDRVRRFQRSRGLADDGAVGRRTLAALEASPAQMIRQIGLNLERLRWRSVFPDTPRIEVNIAAYSLRLIEAGRTVLEMPIVVGLKDWQTPVMTTRMIQVTVNPYWNIPDRITRQETLPAVRADTSYLARNRIEVVTSFGPGARIIDPATVDWESVEAGTFAYRFRQRPGPSNPLGTMKFILDNPYEVHLHDTPLRTYFSRAERALSHGCVRLPRAAELAGTVFARDRSWTADSLNSWLRRGTEATFPLLTSLPVDMVYLTAWVDSAGEIQFRDDVYGYDRRLAARLTGRTAADGSAASNGPA